MLPSNDSRLASASQTAVRTRRELFGVFADRDRFETLRSPDRFDEILAGDAVTVGIRDVGLGIPGRTTIHRGTDGFCVIWGEAFAESGSDRPAEWLFERYVEDGSDAFAHLNGSFIAIVEYDGRAMVVTDPIQSTECFYAEVSGGRVFGTDAARVARTVGSPTIDERALCEFVHFGVVFPPSTPIAEVRRLPFDGYLTADDAGGLDRFRYDPEVFDHASELANRLERAIRRRSAYPGTTGFLMSAGYDSRIILSVLGGVDTCYTLGSPETPEVRVARSIAHQYDAAHQVLPVTSDYLNTSPEIIKYTQGIRESLHIHHRGNLSQLTADTMYHGLMLDTVLRGRYLPHDYLSVGDRRFPLERFDPDPDVASYFSDKLGFFDGGDRVLVDSDAFDSEAPEPFLRDTIANAYGSCLDRATSVYNAMDLLALKLKPALSFRDQLADGYLESFVAMDAELLSWHLRTPPEQRNDETYQRALERIDPAIFQHRPPDRPYRTYRLNQIEKFFREKLPGLQPFGTPWPDRDRIYAEADLDRKLFSDRPDLHPLPPRVKLRIADARTWVALVTGETAPVDELIRTPG